ncbi:hypothetical protein [Marinobacter sp. CHS3-4]|uniref:hypothetical protein n=1 Tax=Marinobacter sp. CHS3-4 TaxID=3045174 RepID=UPI0024B4DE94|nr:hypothetical protein [Marinobacter sp. CHS3-4]MDI9246782.1 hypothetical protein [Marinobacter sp. CHS3-4]
METYFDPKAYIARMATALLRIAAIVTIVIAASPLAAEEIADGGVLTTEQTSYQGTINSVHADSFKIVVDDRAFVLARNLRISDTSWSREQAVLKLSAGQRVTLGLGGISEDDSSLRVVQSITAY